MFCVGKNIFNLEKCYKLGQILQKNFGCQQKCPSCFVTLLVEKLSIFIDNTDKWSVINKIDTKENIVFAHP